MRKECPISEDLAYLARLQGELEEVLLERVRALAKDHPAADSSQFAVNVLLALAGRIGISNLGAERTAYCMEVVVKAIRKHGSKMA